MHRDVSQFAHPVLHVGGEINTNEFAKYNATTAVKIANINYPSLQNIKLCRNELQHLISLL